jgi:hypothetical protein
MPAYIYRSRKNVLVGPFASADDALYHRIQFQLADSDRTGRPANPGEIVSAEEAVTVCIRHKVVRLTPEEDLRIARESRVVSEIA